MPGEVLSFTNLLPGSGSLFVFHVIANRKSKPKVSLSNTLCNFDGEGYASHQPTECEACCVWRGGTI
jgi:hypothetical protein